MSCTHDHNCEDHECSSDWSLYKHIDLSKAFSGTQNVSNQQKEEAWRVNLQIQGIDLEHGYLCGTMEALNVPMADTHVITFSEGEIVDGKNYTFYTGKWSIKSFSVLLSLVSLNH